MNDLDKLRAAGAVETVGDILANTAGGGLVLAFDTETTGLPLFHEPSDDPRQPHVVSLAMELCDQQGNVVDTYDEVINIGVPIPPETIAIHGITDEMAAKGVDPKEALEAYIGWIERASVVTGYNVNFDLRMMRIQAARHLGQKYDCPIPHFDTCFAAKDRCRIPAKRGGGFKKPNLTEAMRHCFDEPHEGAHNALADTQAARRLYFLLRDTMEPMNPRVRIGDNQPPADESAPATPEQPATFATIKAEIEGLDIEARNWLDGEPIANEAQAADVAKLRDKLRDVAARAEKLRKEEAKPFDDGKAEVQGRYNPLIQKDRGKVDLALAACNSALAPWLRKKDDEQRAIAQAAELRANQAAYEAREAARGAADSTDLGKRESAQAMLDEAKGLMGEARRADAAKAQVTGGRRAVGLKSVFRPELVDPAKALAYYRMEQPERLKEWLLEQAQADVRAGKRGDVIPGVVIHEDRVPA
jgi:DNA polymerase III epsilon subunit-like protein